MTLCDISLNYKMHKNVKIVYTSSGANVSNIQGVFSVNVMCRREGHFRDASYLTSFLCTCLIGPLCQVLRVLTVNGLLRNVLRP